MNADEAIWLGELIALMVADLPAAPGMTVEVAGDPIHWLQIVPEEGVDGRVAAFLLNFPFRGQEGDPATVLEAKEIALPPETEVVEWEDGGFARLWIRGDIPLVGLAHLSGDILEKVVGADMSKELSAQIEHGF